MMHGFIKFMHAEDKDFYLSTFKKCIAYWLSFRPRGRQDLGRRQGKLPSISSTETVPPPFPRKPAKRGVRRRKRRSRKG